MSRTLRRSRRHPAKDVRDGAAYHCPEGDCDYCAASRTYTRRRDAMYAALAMREALASYL